MKTRDICFAESVALIEVVHWFIKLLLVCAVIVLDDSDQSDHETVTAATVVKRRKSMPMSPLPSMPDLSSPFYTPLRQKSRHSRHSSAIAMGKRSTDRDWGK